MSALVALDVLLTVELLRAFPALVATQVTRGDRLPLTFQTGVLVAPFIGSAAVILVLRRIDGRRALLASGGLLVLARIGAQLVHGDLGAVIAGAGLLGGLVSLSILASIGLPLLGGGVIAGAGLAAALRVALGSRDLIWIDHPGALGAVLATTIWFGLLLLNRVRRPVELLGRTPRASVPLLALGPALLLEAFVLTNLGWVASALGRGWLASAFAIATCAAVGVTTAAWTAAAPAGLSRALGLAGAIAMIGLAASHASESLGWVVPMAAAQGGIGSLLTAASARGVRTGRVGSPLLVLSLSPLLLLAAVVALDGRGLLGFVVGPSAAVAASGAVMLVAALAALSLPSPTAHHPGWRHVPSLAGIFVLPAVLLLLGLPLLARAGGTGQVGDGRELRVVTYNVRLGFTEDGALNLEEVAAVLAGAGPDVVALQEVPRGFLPTGGIDMIGWLQHSLGMPHVAFQPAAPGALHGNAILSRHPIRTVEVRSFPRSGTSLPRGAIGASIDVPVGEDVLVISSHLPPGGSYEDRLRQVATLVALWGDRPLTVLGLDANAGPTSSRLTALEDAGLVLPDDDAPTFPARSPLTRIDFVLHTADLVAVEVEVLQGRASDHLAVLTVVRPADLV